MYMYNGLTLSHSLMGCPFCFWMSLLFVGCFQDETESEPVSHEVGIDIGAEALASQTSHTGGNLSQTGLASQTSHTGGNLSQTGLASQTSHTGLASQTSHTGGNLSQTGLASQTSQTGFRQSDQSGQYYTGRVLIGRDGCFPEQYRHGGKGLIFTTYTCTCILT